MCFHLKRRRWKKTLTDVKMHLVRGFKFVCFTWRKWRQNLHPAAAVCRTKHRWQKAQPSVPPGSDGSGTWISSFSRKMPFFNAFRSHKTQLKLTKELVKCGWDKVWCWWFQFVFSWELRFFRDDSAQKSEKRNQVFSAYTVYKRGDCLRFCALKVTKDLPGDILRSWGLNSSVSGT